MKTFVKYVAVLTGLYIIVAHYTGAGTLITDSAKAGSGFVTTVQGR